MVRSKMSCDQCGGRLPQPSKLKYGMEEKNRSKKPRCLFCAWGEKISVGGSIEIILNEGLTLEVRESTLVKAGSGLFLSNLGLIEQRVAPRTRIAEYTGKTFTPAQWKKYRQKLNSSQLDYNMTLANGKIIDAFGFKGPLNLSAHLVNDGMGAFDPAMRRENNCIFDERENAIHVYNIAEIVLAPGSVVELLAPYGPAYWRIRNRNLQTWCYFQTREETEKQRIVRDIAGGLFPFAYVEDKIGLSRKQLRNRVGRDDIKRHSFADWVASLLQTGVEKNLTWTLEEVDF